jgi:hypothetical protein
LFFKGNQKEEIKYRALNAISSLIDNKGLMEIGLLQHNIFIPWEYDAEACEERLSFEWDRVLKKEGFTWFQNTSEANQLVNRWPCEGGRLVNRWYRLIDCYAKDKIA